MVFFFYLKLPILFEGVHFNIPVAAVLLTRFKTFHCQLKFYSTSSLTFNLKFLSNCFEDGCLTFKLRIVLYLFGITWLLLSTAQEEYIFNMSTVFVMLSVLFTFVH